MKAKIKNDWIDISLKTPKTEGYYDVKYFDGEEDSKPFRIRPSQSIYGFMTSKIVTHWRNSTDKQNFEID